MPFHVRVDERHSCTVRSTLHSIADFTVSAKLRGEALTGHSPALVVQYLQHLHIASISPLHLLYPTPISRSTVSQLYTVSSLSRPTAVLHSSCTRTRCLSYVRTVQYSKYSILRELHDTLA